MSIPNTIQNVMIWPNTGKEGIGYAITQTAEVLREFGANVILPERATEIGLDTTCYRVLPTDQGMQESDFVIVLGGDGTILAMAQYAAVRHAPILGINLGHVGFMSELEFPELRSISKVFSGDYTIDSRMMLNVEVERNKQIVYRTIALNEAIIKTGSIFRISLLDVHCDGDAVCSLHGDGVIVSTPTGTTAYSLAAGGPVIEPSAENISVVPICPHGAQAKSYVFSPHREISVIPRFFNDASILVSGDGRKSFELQSGDKVYIRKSKYETQLIRVKGKSFYSLLNEKLSIR